MENWSFKKETHEKGYFKDATMKPPRSCYASLEAS